MRPWLHLARISNLPTVWTNVTAAWLLAGGALTDARLCWLILAGSLLYTGGMILNDAADAKFDAEHRKERPIPSGQVSLRAAGCVGVGMLLGGAGLALFFGAGLWITCGLVACILFYDLYHKPWSGSIIVMGACRVLLYLMAASAATPVFERVLPFAIALGGYIVGITLAARLEHKTGRLAVPSWILAFALLGAPLINWVFCNPPDDNRDSFIIAAYALLLLEGIRHLDRGGPEIGKAVGILLAGIVIVDAFAVATVSAPVALGFVILAPFLRLWQRWVAAT